MTLIAYAVSDDAQSVEIVTDSRSYTRTFSHLGHGIKVTPLPHLDAVALHQGDVAFGHLWDFGVKMAVDDTPDFDALLAQAGDLARQAWTETHQLARVDQRPDRVARSLAVLIGYSPAAGGFTAFECASDQDFEPHTVAGLFVHPSPLFARPSEYELRSIRAHAHPTVVEQIEALPHPSAPRNAEEWTNLAVMTRTARSYLAPDTGLKVFVGGDIFHTHLERGYAHTVKILEFDRDPEDFQAVIAGTLHPQSQLGPCGCGSGNRYIDCCLVPHLDEGCLCGSDRSLRDCCSVAFDATAAPVGAVRAQG